MAKIDHDKLNTKRRLQTEQVKQSQQEYYPTDAEQQRDATEMKEFIVEQHGNDVEAIAQDFKYYFKYNIKTARRLARRILKRKENDRCIKNI